MSEHFKDAYLAAQEKGLDVVLPLDNQLQLDIDSDADYMFMDHQIKVLASNNEDHVIDKETKSNGGNKHVYISLNRTLTTVERIALQACLGSDRKRELLSLLHVIQGHDGPASVMFEVPQKCLPAPQLLVELTEVEKVWDEFIKEKAALCHSNTFAVNATGGRSRTLSLSMIRSTRPAARWVAGDAAMDVRGRSK